MTPSQRGLRGAFAVVLACAACSDDGVPADGGGSEAGTTGSSATTPADTSGGSQTTVDAEDGPADVDTSGGLSDGTSGGGTTGANPEASPGCGMAYAGEPVVSGAIDVDGVQRTFILSVPAGYDPAVPMPLVFAWHGLGGDGELARLYFNVEQESAGAAIFVYPDGLPQQAMGGQTGWELVDGSADVLFFDTLLAEFSNNLCIDPDRIFSTGHSFGGYMSNALGCFRADVLRAIAPVAGGPPFQACQGELVAAWMTHGTADEVVPFAQGEAARDAVVARNGCGSDTAATPPEPCVAYDGCDPDYPVVWCAHDLTQQAGHLWPPFAAAAIWTFFAGLPVPAAP